MLVLLKVEPTSLSVKTLYEGREEWKPENIFICNLLTLSVIAAGFILLIRIDKICLFSFVLELGGERLGLNWNVLGFLRCQPFLCMGKASTPKLRSNTGWIGNTAVVLVVVVVRF